MNKKNLRFLSLAFFVLGVFFLLNSKIDITGAVIGLPDISSGFSSILGIAFIVGSILVFQHRRGGDDGELEIVITDSFRKIIKKHNKEDNDIAIDKIDTGLGHPVRVDGNTWKLRGGKGYDLTYEVAGNVVTPTDYSHR